MSKSYSKELLLSSELLYSFDEAKNSIVFISYYGRLQFSMYQKDCILIKKGQRLQILYRLKPNAGKSKNLNKIKVRFGSLFVFLRQFISRLEYPSYSSLSLIGMGYHSNKIIVGCPNEIKIFVRKSQRQHTISFFSSTLFDSKNLASKIIKYRPVSPYTGKGLVWLGHKILRKEGKGQFKR
jgi:hypothetical protein